MSAYVELLNPTRGAIVRLLKRQDDLTASALATALEISAVAIRRHLERLEQQGLVRHVAERCERGRPQHRYSLTEQGDRLFPDRSAALACDLLRRLVGSLGDDAFRTMIAEQTDATIAELVVQFGHLSFEERVRALASHYNELGYVTEVTALEGGGFRIVEHNCPTREVAEQFPALCEEELRVFREVAGARVLRDCRIAEGEKTCVYRLEAWEPGREARALPVLNQRAGRVSRG